MMESILYCDVVNLGLLIGCLLPCGPVLLVQPVSTCDFLVTFDVNQHVYHVAVSCIHLVLIECTINSV